jgi:hypothetical protein
LRDLTALSLGKRLASAGLTIDDIDETLTEHPNGIAQKYAGRLRDEIERSYSKWKTSARLDHSNGPAPGHTERASVHENAYDWDCPDWSIFEDRRGELPDFPKATLPENCQLWAERAAQGAGATLAHVVVPMLGIVASLIGTARRVKASRSWTEPMTIINSPLTEPEVASAASVGVLFSILRDEIVDQDVDIWQRSTMTDLGARNGDIAHGTAINFDPGAITFFNLIICVCFFPGTPPDNA